MLALAEAQTQILVAEGWGPLRWLGRFLERGRKAPSVVDSTTVEVEIVAAKLGPDLLVATNRDDLVERIDAVLARPELPELVQFFQRAVDALRELPLESIRLQEVELSADVVRVLGRGPSLVLQQGGLWATVSARVFRELVDDATKDELAKAIDIAYSPRDLIYDPDTPIEVAEVNLAAFRGAVAMIGIVHALTEGVRLDPWVALALCELFAGGQREALRLLAAIKPDAVSPAILPPQERFDLTTALERHAEREARIATAIVSADEG